MKIFCFIVLILFCQILNAQNVGIGTSSPDEKLHISNGQVKVSRSSTSGNNNVLFNMPEGNAIIGEVQGLSFQVNDISVAGIVLQNNGTAESNTLRFSTSTPTSSDMVIKSYGTVGIGTSSPHSSAALDISSSEKGILIPRMTRTERDAIVSPLNGLLLYQTNETPGFYYNAGSPSLPNWVNIAKRVDTLVIGPEAFLPTRNETGYTLDAHSARFIDVDGNTETLRASVQLPSGVTIKQMKLFFYDESSTSNLTFKLVPNYLEEGLVSSTTFEYTSSGNISGPRTGTVNGNYVLKNNTYSYHINVYPSTGSWSFSGDLKIKGALLVYEY